MSFIFAVVYERSDVFYSISVQVSKHEILAYMLTEMQGTHFMLREDNQRVLIQIL